MRPDLPVGSPDGYGNFGVARDGLSVAGLGVFPKDMFRAFPAQDAAVPPKVSKQRLALHPITTSSCLAS